MVVILPETKGISLERMDKLFGEVDAVEAGENQQALEKIDNKVSKKDVKQPATYVEDSKEAVVSG